MRSRLNFESQGEEASIDMTPMLDVVFIMLIFFIVSTTFIRDEGVDINTPSANHGIEKTTRGVIVAIDKSGAVWLDQSRVPIDELQDSLSLALSKKTAESVLIKADEKTATKDLIAVIDILKILNVKQVAVATKSP